MKPVKERKNIIKEQILERNNRIEDYILNYLSTKNSQRNLYYNKVYNTLDNSKTNNIQHVPKKEKISNSRPKISRIPVKKRKKDLNQNSYISYMKSRKSYINNNSNNTDNEDALTMATRKTMESFDKYKENKENININSSYINNSTISNIDLNKNKNSSYVNKKFKKNIISSDCSNKNLNFVLKKIPKLFDNSRRKGLKSFHTFKNMNNISNDSKNINHSYAKLNPNYLNNSINTIQSYKRKNNLDISIDSNYLNTHIKKCYNKDFIREKSNTIDVIRTIKKIKNPIIYIIDNNNKNQTIDNHSNYIYNKKNNFSSFSNEKKIRNKSQKNNINIDKINFEIMISKEINLEDFLLIIQKLEIIKSSITLLPEKIKNIKQLVVIINSIKIKIYDLYKFYFGCLFEGAPENLFASKKIKINLHYYSIILVMSLALIYILTNKIKMTQDFFPQIINLFNFQQKLFLLLSDMVIHKIKINASQKIWAREIMNILNNKLMFKTENHISEMKKIILNSYYLINEILLDLKFKNENGLVDLNEQEIFFMNFYFRNSINSLYKYSLITIEDLFNSNIFKIYNIKSNYTNIALRNKSQKNMNIENDILNNKSNEFEIIIPNTNNPIKLNPKIPYLKFPPKKEYTLVLDLDETLIYFNFININKNLGKVRLRPGLLNFLEIIKEFYEIIVFTSSTKDYADIILNAIEKKGNSKFFDGRLYREHNLQIEQKFYKDLSRIGRNLTKTLIVDNFNHTFKFQKENGILISSFYGENKEDKALIELQKILIKIYNEKGDVRKSIIKYREEIFRKVSYSNKY